MNHDDTTKRRVFYVVSSWFTSSRQGDKIDFAVLLAVHTYDTVTVLFTLVVERQIADRTYRL